MVQGSNALRLTFSHKDGVVQLVSKEEVEMTVPPGDAIEKRPQRGFWAELHDASNNALFRRVLHNPIPVDTEVFSDDPGKTLARAPVAPAEGMFSIVVPNQPEAASLALFSSHHEASPSPSEPPQGISDVMPYFAVRAVPGHLDEAREIARFDLKKSQ
jgi:hypothetical protein